MAEDTSSVGDTSATTGTDQEVFGGTKDPEEEARKKVEKTIDAFVDATTPPLFADTVKKHRPRIP